MKINDHTYHQIKHHGGVFNTLSSRCGGHTKIEMLNTKQYTALKGRHRFVDGDINFGLNYQILIYLNLLAKVKDYT